MGALETANFNCMIGDGRKRDAVYHFSMDDNTTPDTPEISFDPTTPAEWDALGTLAHRMVDDMLHHLQHLPEQPAWREMPPAVASSFDGPPPKSGVGFGAVYEEFRTRVLPFPNGNLHPRFFGWVQGNGTAYAMLADMLASGFNPNVAGFNQAPKLVEQQVIAWFAQLFGIPSADGVLVSGGSMANTHALAVARHTLALRLGRAVREEGLQHWPGTASNKPLVFYGSTETHGWARKAAVFLGLGERAFRQVPVDANYCIDLDALETQLKADKAAGLQPFCIVGTAGTVNTGASDDLVRLSEICKREELWFHIDGAFGAFAWLSPTLRDQVHGLDLADSLAFDLHKWGSMPFDCACVLVRDSDALVETYRSSATYLSEMTRGVSADRVYFANRGVDLTRNFKALKVWMSLQADGVDKLVSVVEQNVRHTQHVVSRIEAHPELELLAPAPLNIVCFRYFAPELDDQSLNALNTEILLRMQERGIAVPSSTELNGRFAIRVANVNHRARLADVEAVVDATIEIGREVLDEMRQESGKSG